ncbi:cytidine deaminase-like protein [Tothia fuscella]|uniref:Cytidine deaminase-like protein n=1 Tax=Tothia fuscella TaxID=1048955 RepID=A0A9P4U1D9_9PEZI|nr:cytidine deaminase-like protein [Tothia fuscella]
MDNPLHYLQLALNEARKSPPKPTNYCVGALLLDTSTATPTIVTTGYTLECPGNTHAEQCCFIKLAAKHNLPEERVGEVLPEEGCVLFTTMEPCAYRASGNITCVERILRCGRIKTVVSGVREPDTFVEGNNGRSILEKAGVKCIYVRGLEEEILEVAKAGHVQQNDEMK